MVQNGPGASLVRSRTLIPLSGGAEGMVISPWVRL
jgi:hypothetical protein